MITINTNMASIIAQNSFNKCSTSMNRALERLSTGYKINSSKDDAAGNAIATKLETKISSYAQATKNAEMGADYLQSADSTITTMQNMVQRMRDLTEQAANGTYGDDERKALQAEIDGLTAELYRIKNSTEMNGKKILGEEEQPQLVQPNIMMSAISTLDTVADGTVIGISTAGDLLKLAEMTNDKQDTTGITFVLTNNIDLGSVDNFTAIGHKDAKFSGTFDGNNYSIHNLTIHSTSANQGLFGSTNEYSIIINVNVKNANITITGNVAGIVVGNNGGTIKNCTASGRVFANQAAGGLVGQNIGAGSIENCSASGKVSGGKIVGGFVGQNTGGGTIKNCSAKSTVTVESERAGGFAGNNQTGSSIENCTASSTVSGSRVVGGLVGINSSSTIENCSAKGTVTAELDRAGGLVGANQGPVENCTASSTVSGDKDVGGFAGYNSNSINNCTASGTVLGNEDVGGFVGDCRGNVTNCTSLVKSVTGNTSVGAFAGYVEDPEFDNCFYDNIDGLPTDEIGKIVGTVTGTITGESNPKIFSHVNNSDTLTDFAETEVNLQVGIQADKNSTIQINTGFAMGNFSVNVVSDDSARISLEEIDALMDRMTAKKTDIGASLNRLESVMAQQEAMRTSMTSALSQIKDADIAKESANYIKNQILQQTTASLLATANQNPNIALNLL